MNHYADPVTCQTGTMMIDEANVQPVIFKDIFWEWSAPLDATNQISVGGSIGQAFQSGDTYEQSFLTRPRSFS